jgi:hypothetical protein
MNNISGRGTSLTVELNPTGYTYPAQIIGGLLFTIVLFVVCFACEFVYRTMFEINKSRVRLLDMTVSSKGKPYMFTQDPRSGDSAMLYMSNNERSGPEFSYSFYIFVGDDNVTTENGLNHVFHKGYAGQYPLLGPGVYMHSNTNKMRVYMNSYETWNNYVDIDNFPVKKWVHVVIVCKGKAIDVFVNGNVAKRLVLERSVPYQNFQNVHVFSDRRVRICTPGSGTGDAVCSDVEDLNVFGVFSGMLSNLTYYSYAISYTEIADLMAEGPSKKTDTMDQSRPPYLADQWWTQ